MQNIHLVVYKGETFNPPPISYRDCNRNLISLIGYMATFSVATDEGQPIVLQANSYNGQCIINTNGQILINIPLEILLPLFPFTGEWDLFIYSPVGVATRLVGGTIELKESVTG